MNIDPPPKWANTYFDNIISRISNGISSSQTKNNEGFPVTRIETISDGNINYKRIGFVENLSTEEKIKYRLQKNDVLFSHINSPPHLGKTAIYILDNKELFHGTNLLLIRVYEQVCNPKFFNYYCRYLRLTGYFSLNAQHAVNQASLNQNKIKNFEILLPPLNEQKRIADKLDILLAKVDSCKARLDKVPGVIKQFRQAVLAAACAGN